MPKRLTLAKIFLESFLWQIFCSSIFLSTYFFAKRIVSQILAKKCFWAPSWQDSGAGGRSRIVHFMNFSYGPLNLQTCKVSKLPDFFPGKPIICSPMTVLYGMSVVGVKTRLRPSIDPLCRLSPLPRGCTDRRI